MGINLSIEKAHKAENPARWVFDEVCWKTYEKGGKEVTKCSSKSNEPISVEDKNGGKMTTSVNFDNKWIRFGVADPEYASILPHSPDLKKIYLSAEDSKTPIDKKNIITPEFYTMVTSGNALKTMMESIANGFVGAPKQEITYQKPPANWCPDMDPCNSEICESCGKKVVIVEPQKSFLETMNWPVVGGIAVGLALLIVIILGFVKSGKN